MRRLRRPAEQFGRENPDAVTMDILMPDMDGMDVVRKIMEADPDAKAIICSTDKQKFRRKRPGRSALWDSFPNQLTRIPCSDF